MSYLDLNKLGFEKVIIINSSYYISISKDKSYKKEILDILNTSSINLSKNNTNGDFAIL